MIVDGKRALAYTVIVDAIDEIEGADNIALATVGGWKVIVKKEEFKPGDVAVFFEIDSKLPEINRYEFMARKHYKVKTMKLGKFNVVSQGLLMPLSEFPELAITSVNLKDAVDPNHFVGIDLTDVLHITYAEAEDNKRKAAPNSNAKYQSMATRHKKIFRQKWARWMMRRDWGRKVMFLIFGRKKDNPKYFPKHFEFVHPTDEERVENMPWILNDKRKLIATEKLDGTSTTFILERKKHRKFWDKDPYEFYVLSRHVRQLDPDQSCYHDYNIYWAMAEKYNVKQHLIDYLEDYPRLAYVCIQGESVGKVQGNPLKLVEDDFYGFNFIQSDVGRLPSLLGKSILEGWGMKWVPIVDTEWINPDTMEEMKALATGKSLVNPDVLREGLVYRDEDDNTFSFKNVSNEFLMSKK